MKKYFGTIATGAETWESIIEVEAVYDRHAARKTLTHFYDLGMVEIGKPTRISIALANRPEDPANRLLLWVDYKGKVMTEVELLD